ncbi:MAG: hypothetical protein QOF64_2675 [Candidatus Binatota bacterium]|nr:hypothetical protein [Candidatus Binatota bacterium]
MYRWVDDRFFLIPAGEREVERVLPQLSANEMPVPSSYLWMEQLMICPLKPRVEVAGGVRSCELLDTDLSTEVAASLFSSAPANGHAANRR